MRPPAQSSAPPSIPAARRARDARLIVGDLASRYRVVRETTLALVAPLSVEDASAQSMPDASPAKWHLAHTTWFMETFVLERAQENFAPFDPVWRVLFNSYYNTVGPQHARPSRGLLTRPSFHQVLDYRDHVDAAMTRLLEKGALDDALLGVVVLGLHHEQQHQELILMDIKHLFSCNPIAPAYAAPAPSDAATTAPLRWIACEGGLTTIGAAAEAFSFDNERPHHRVSIEPFAIASRLVTNGEYLAFVRDGGYRRPELWQSDGWDAVGRWQWDAPLYWRERDGAWLEFTLAGERPLAPVEPVCHVSWYEADAYARWAEARLPDEAEWESAALPHPIEGNFLESGALHPAPASALASGAGAVLQIFGDVWEWTRSAYGPYPGYRPPAGAIGEYNGKFMINQMVLRGGSCATPASHIRASYRNFFYPAHRWQFGGIRLARDAR